MNKLITDHGDSLMVLLFIVLAGILHFGLKKSQKSLPPRPKWASEFIWKLYTLLRAPLIFNIVLLSFLAVCGYVDLPEYRMAVMPLTSLGVAWFAGAIIKMISGSRISAWFIGLSFCFLSLLQTLPGGKLLLNMLNDKAIALPLGETGITPYNIIKTIVLLVTFFLLAGSLVKPVESYLRKRREIRASNRNLIVQFLKILLYTAVVLISLNILGIDLTTLTVFGGALGVGLGFGLQKITSNFISGIILLLEQSVEEDDLIELSDGTLGFIRKNGARYTLIETFDSKEILVPNEDFITNRVTNWTYSNPAGRIEVKIGIAYKSDIESARKLMLEAAKAQPLCADYPEPICYLNEFGDSSVNFILHFWIDDVKIGRLKPIDSVLTAIWQAFKENDIEIPYPQRDVHLKEPPTKS